MGTLNSKHSYYSYLCNLLVCLMPITLIMIQWSWKLVIACHLPPSGPYCRMCHEAINAENQWHNASFSCMKIISSLPLLDMPNLQPFFLTGCLHVLVDEVEAHESISAKIATIKTPNEASRRKTVLKRKKSSRDYQKGWQEKPRSQSLAAWELNLQMHAGSLKWRHR